MSTSAAVDRAEADSRETLALRRAIYGKGDATRADFENLLARGREAGAGAEFAALIAEVATDVLVHQVDPVGYVTEADAAWLVARLSQGGGLACHAEFETLKAIFGHAVSVPPVLTAFAVREVEKAILTGRRDAMGGIDHEPGVVTREDVEALRAMAFAPTQGSSLHVDKGTAEALFDIAHATATAANAPEFAEFFAQAVGNYLMGVAFSGTADRVDVLRHEAELDKPTGFRGFFAAMTRGPSRAEVADALESTEAEEEDAYLRENLDTERRLREAENVGGDQAKWIIAHLTRGGPLTEAEKRLLRFLADEAASTPTELTALLDRAA
jgi:hypothetical protein